MDPLTCFSLSLRALNFSEKISLLKFTPARKHLQGGRGVRRNDIRVQSEGHRGQLLEKSGLRNLRHLRARSVANSAALETQPVLARRASFRNRSTVTDVRQ